MSVEGAVALVGIDWASEEQPCVRWILTAGAL